jgi:redox-sensing transcriptional repressor
MERAIPDIVVGRLPHYLRALQHMSLEGRRLTSSQELSERLGISAAQIRKDLSLFGEFGKQGTGYQIDYLLNQLRQILKVNQIWDIALVGAGDMGSAIARYQGFTDRGFRVVMIFDNDPSVIGSQIGPFIIQSTNELVVAIQSADVRIAMLAVPAANAQEVADMLVQAGIKSILNYAPISLNVPDDVHVQYIDPVIHLQRMTYYLE